MMSFHAEVSMRLTYAVLQNMRHRNQGKIINVASLGAFLPCAKSVQYASTKAYLVVFSEALREELRDTNVRVQALCPGFVHTNFHKSDSMQSIYERRIPKQLWMQPEDVVSHSLQSLERDQVIVVPGRTTRLLGLFMRMPLLKPLVRAATRAPAAPSRSRNHNPQHVANF